jgi:hypothetical protein
MGPRNSTASAGVGQSVSVGCGSRPDSRGPFTPTHLWEFPCTVSDTIRFRAGSRPTIGRADLVIVVSHSPCRSRPIVRLRHVSTRKSNTNCTAEWPVRCWEAWFRQQRDPQRVGERMPYLISDVHDKHAVVRDVRRCRACAAPVPRHARWAFHCAVALTAASPDQLTDMFLTRPSPPRAHDFHPGHPSLCRASRANRVTVR